MIQDLRVFRLMVVSAGLFVVMWGCDCTDDTGIDEGSECTSSAECPDDEECVDGTCQDFSEQPDAGADADAATGDDVGPDDDADAGDEPDGGEEDPDCPDANTCEEMGAECGFIPNGCGGVVDCGGCPDGESCGLGDDANQCVEVDCSSDVTCEQEGVECGAIPDGCGGVVNCGGCGDGQVCGTGDDAGTCLDQQCQPMSCDDFDPGECGLLPDGCGGIVDCGSCADGDSCNTDTEEGLCEAIPCTPLTCADYDPGECGPHPDGCGGYIDCGTCGSDQVCGTGAEFGECVDPQCDPLTCADYDDVNCGQVSDGCGGLTADCGDCTDPEICGGGGQPNVCGADPSAGGGCTNLCLDQVVCSGGDATTVEGTVYAPNGTLPIPNATVYVPNDPIADLPDVEQATDCEPCDDIDLGSPLVGTISDYDGTFELRNVPANTSFPLVIRHGQWRRVVTVDPIAGCDTVQLSSDDTRLPKTHEEQSNHDHIPKIAVSTGRIDAMECVLHQIGVESSEFTRHSEDGRIHLYRANGGVPDSTLASACQESISCGWFCTTNVCTNSNCTDRDPNSCYDGSNGAVLDDNLSYNLYNDLSTMMDYDMIVMDCEGTENTGRTTTELNRMRDYVNAGGRLFASHFAYDWLHETSELEDTATWGGGGFDSYTRARVNTSAGGGNFWDWLLLMDAEYSVSPPEIEIEDPRGYVMDIDDSLATELVYTIDGATGHVDYDSVQQYTFATPVYDPPEDQCGQVAYSAFHVANASTGHGPEFPTYCSTTMSSQEKVLAYTLFDLAGCVTDDNEPPEPECEPLTCADRGAECGQVSDGCGEVLDCGDCPDGSACGAGGEPNICSSVCQPMSCDDHGAECGTVADGCGGTIDCGVCPDGEACGADGEPNQCACVPLTCSDHGAECGEVSDGCGGTLDCGDCPDGEQCGAGGTPNVCSADCEPMTCSDHGAECGSVADGCGGTIDCGDCPDPLTCGAEGELNQCGCVPLTCEDHDVECGEVSDGCGETLNCGDCPDGVCQDNVCVCLPTDAECEENSECCSGNCAGSSDGQGTCVIG